MPITSAFSLGYILIIALIVFLLTQARNRQILSAKVRELLVVKAQLEEANQQLSFLSGIDPLTGIANDKEGPLFRPLLPDGYQSLQGRHD